MQPDAACGATNSFCTIKNDTTVMTNLTSFEGNVTTSLTSFANMCDFTMDI